MPIYYCENGLCAKSKTDEEKRSHGFMKGDCMDASITKLIELHNKFGNHFSLAMKVVFRKTTSIVRHMTDEEIKRWYRLGDYQIHFCVYNRKNKQYIDTSNGDVMISSLESERKQFNSEYNRVYRIYHYPLPWIVKKYDGDIGALCIEKLLNQNRKPYSNKQEKKLVSEGVEIISC